MGFHICTLSQDTKWHFQKCTSIVGFCVLLMSNGVFWYWGNMSVYCMSYFVSVKHAPEGADSPWIYAFYSTFWTIGMLTVHKIRSRIGGRLTIFLGILIFDTGIFTSYFAMHDSLLALTVTMGALTGIGTGFMDAMSISMAVDWAKENAGLISALCQGSLSLGALVVNAVVTKYANPQNLAPDLYLNPSTYFTQKEVLDNVPSMFLILGCVTMSLHLIGFAMIRERESSSEKVSHTYDTSSERTALIQGETDSGLDVAKESKYFVKGAAFNGTRNECRDSTYKQMLKSKTFYAYWIFNFACGMPFTITGNYYKMFGQNWIKDDYFMSLIGTSVGIVNMVLAIVFGLSIDFFGIKKCQITSTVILTLLMLWYYFTPRCNPWVFFTGTLMLGSLSGAVTACMTSAIVKQYGRKHFTTNFGLYTTSQLCFNLISPFIMGYLLRTIGWFLTFVCSGVSLLVTLIPTFLFVPNI